MTTSDVETALADLKDPETGRSLTKQGQVSDIRIEGNNLSLTLALSTHSAPLWKQTQEECIALLRSRLQGLAQIDVRLAVFPRPPQKLGEIGLTAKTVIAVGSGKGGVGKSTMAA